jgi:hypothetical protein
LNAEPGADTEFPGVVGVSSQDWLGCPVPGGFTATTTLLSAHESTNAEPIINFRIFVYLCMLEMTSLLSVDSFQGIHQCGAGRLSNYHAIVDVQKGIGGGPGNKKQLVEETSAAES